jgi:hypothetical protein
VLPNPFIHADADAEHDVDDELHSDAVDVGVGDPDAVSEHHGISQSGAFRDAFRLEQPVVDSEPVNVAEPDELCEPDAVDDPEPVVV